MCTIMVCKEVVLKKVTVLDGLPCRSVDVYSAGTLLNLDFAVRMTENHWALARHWSGKDARDRQNVPIETLGVKIPRDLIALLLCCSREKQKQEARFETKSRSKAFRRWGCFCKSEFWLLCHDKSTILWSFCDHSAIMLMSQPLIVLAIRILRQEQAASRARKKAAADLDIDEPWSRRFWSWVSWVMFERNCKIMGTMTK